MKITIVNSTGNHVTIGLNKELLMVATKKEVWVNEHVAAFKSLSVEESELRKKLAETYDIVKGVKPEEKKG